MMDAMIDAGAIYCNESDYENSGILVCSNRPLEYGQAVPGALSCLTDTTGYASCGACDVNSDGSAVCVYNNWN